MSLLTSITPLYLSTLVEFITSMLYFLQSMYTLIIFVIMELVDVYGLFLVFFIFTNFVLFYYNFFFQVFLFSKEFAINAVTINPTGQNTTAKLTLFSTTFLLFKRSLTSTLNTLTREILK